MLSIAKAITLIKSLPLLIVGIVGVGLVIAWHEFGHFLLAKLFRMKTPSFSIGFGPKIFKRKIGQTEFSLSAIPWGGYVEFAVPDEQEAAITPRPTTGEDYLEYRPYWQKMLVIGGGILFNLAFAYTVFIALYAVGIPASPLFYPENARPVIVGTEPEAAAAKAGLLPGDRIVTIDGQSLGDHMELYAELINAKPNQTVQIAIDRQGHEETKSVQLGAKNVGGKEVGVLGVTGFEMGDLPAQPFGTAIKQGIRRVNMLIYQLIMVFRWMFVARTTEGLGGPLMIFSQTMKSAQHGLETFFAVLALISVNLAVVNLIPLPILDGGQAAIVTIEAIIRRPLPIRMREIMAIATWAIFIGLTLFLTFRDIKVLHGGG